MSKLGCAVSIAAVSLAVAGTSYARQDDGEQTAREGVVACGGTNFLRRGDTEIHFTNYNLRNLNATTPIRIERVVVYLATGAVLFDSDVHGFPAFESNRLGPDDQLLDPRQTAQLGTDVLLPFLAEDQRPLQVEFTWSAPERVLTLGVSATRVVRGRNAATGQQLDERSRDAAGCRNVSLR